MPGKSYKPEEIVGILRDIEIQNGQGKRIQESCWEQGISEAIYYRWRKGYGNLHHDQAKRLKEQEKRTSA